MSRTAPWPVMIVAAVIILGALATLGALWSGSEAGRAFAQATTSSYESAWLPWAAVFVTIGCGLTMLLGWSMARWVLLFWMAYGVVEGLFLLEERHANPIVIGVYAVVAGLLFLPVSNDWFRKD